jgi:hypothetical protein
VRDPGDGGFNSIVGYFYYLILPKLLHVSVVRPSSWRNILGRITRLTKDPLFFLMLIRLYFKSNGSVVSPVILGNIFLLEDGRATETCSSLGSIK